MRRKSERNKTKGSPEKKVEKPTRKSTRRRGKRSPSTSPEQDVMAEEAARNAAQVKETSKEINVEIHLQKEESEQPQEVHEEAVTSSEKNVKADSPEDETDQGGSVWKVARADASPGEIQKLKLCRQRNTSDVVSDASSSSRKSKSSKWQESGEGVAEEADSADEQLVSCTRMLSSAEQPNDPSSSYPGQDSNEEVSDSKEILPETTSANLLSDDKPNIDQHGESNEANCAAQIVDSEPSKPSSTTTAPAPSTNGDYPCEESTAAAAAAATVVVVVVAAEDDDDAAAAAAAAAAATTTTEIVADTPKEDKSAEDASEKLMEATFSKEVSVENARRDTSSEDEEEENKVKERRPVDTSSDSNDESRAKNSRSSDRSSPRAPIRRKHRNKYGDSSNSDTAESEDEPRTVDRKVSESVEEEEEEEEKPSAEYSREDKERSLSPERTNSHSNNAETIVEIEHCEAVQHKPEDTSEKSEPTVVPGVQAVAQKPVKVNLKRSFSARTTSEKNEVKRDDTDVSVNNESCGQNKENHNGNEQEPKCMPRKRRWGIALSTDTTPSFSISTDSLKALVPGAKPLSINEVRLSKDDDEDRDRHKSNDKRHNSGDSTNDKITDENLQKNGAAKKGNAKIDNHIATRRKISIVKEMPHVKSPSPPTSKPTNILLIKNLVRPFTLNQIKELLSRTGTIVENGFWMDRIKSKCIVEYSNEDQAFETRQALHGISWPMSNPKKLHVEYATKEDMETARESSKDQPVVRKTEPLSSSDPWQQEWGREEKTNTTKVTVVREWDLGKEDGQQHIREKEREKKEDRKRRQRSRSPALEAHLPAPARKFKKKEDDPPPAKLLDDLFRKTKATPCIYWLPLTNEQIVVKEEMRRQHMAEHARRLEEMRRADRNRDGRRRRSPRK